MTPRLEAEPMNHRRRSLTVASIMQVDLVRLAPTYSLRETLYAMTQARARYAVVEREGVFEGLVSDRDVRFALPSRLGASHPGQPHRLLDETTVEAVRIKRPFSVRLNDSAAAAARLMLSKRIGCLPVVDDQGRAIGLVTQEDFTRVFVGLSTPDEQARTDAVRPLVA
jgi:CBS domain-containing protein